MLKTRVKTGILVGAVLCLAVLFSHYQWFLSLVLSGLSILGIYEILTATGLHQNRVFCAVSCIMSIWLCGIRVTDHALMLSGFCVFGAVVMLVYLMYQVGKRTHIPLGILLFLVFFIPLSLKATTFIRTEEQGFFLLIFAILVSTITDIAAFFIGSHWGKRPLAPTISPKKTIEGSFGGTAAAIIVLVALAFLWEKLGIVNVDYSSLVIYLFRASLIGQLGDLAFSSVKRIVGIKDFGTLLPGHGGILDRFDSMLFVLPFTYVFDQFYGPVFH